MSTLMHCVAGMHIFSKKTYAELFNTFQHRSSNQIKTAAALVFAALIVGCGGSGGGESSDTSELSMATQDTKAFHFTWNRARGATEYRLLEDADGESGPEDYTRVATIGGDATSYSLPVSLHLRVNARYILQTCTQSGCKDSKPIAASGNLAGAVGYVKASNTGDGDVFGTSLVLSADGNTMAIGAPGEDSAAVGINGSQSDNSAGQSGAAYVFTRSNSGWTQQAYIKASNAAAGDQFGFSLALSADGNTLAVSATGEDSDFAGTSSDGTGEADNDAEGSGAVYIFARTNSAWSQQAYIKASNSSTADTFGHGISLSADGNTLAVSAHLEDSNHTGVSTDGTGEANNSAADSGAAYVFTRSGTNWSQTAYVKATNTLAGDQFGYSVAISGNGTTLAVGARYENVNATGINGDQSNRTVTYMASGAVYVYSLNNGTWDDTYVKASNTGHFDQFGSKVALSFDGNTMVVGAPYESSSSAGINGDQGDDPDTAYAGAAYIFVRAGGIWSQQAYVKSANPHEYQYFGNLALSSDGNTLAIGATGESSNATGLNGNQADLSAESSGAVYVFVRNGTSWQQKSYIKASNTTTFDVFGHAIALSGDGKTLAVSAREEDSNATGINGDQANDASAESGAVYLY